MESCPPLLLVSSVIKPEKNVSSLDQEMYNYAYQLFEVENSHHEIYIRRS